MAVWLPALLQALLFAQAYGTVAASAAATFGKVHIIRHGEKHWALGCLSDAGHARANNLVTVFSGKTWENYARLEPPKYIFAHWYHDFIDCERCNQTVTPLAEALGIKIDLTHGGGQPGTGPNGGNKGAAAAILKALKATGGPVLVAWEHINIQHLTEDLGVEPSAIPTWEGSDYDSIYSLQINISSGVLHGFEHDHENFTTDASSVSSTSWLRSWLRSDQEVVV